MKSKRTSKGESEKSKSTRIIFSISYIFLCSMYSVVSTSYIFLLFYFYYTITYRLWIDSGYSNYYSCLPQNQMIVPKDTFSKRVEWPLKLLSLWETLKPAADLFDRKLLLSCGGLTFGLAPVSLTFLGCCQPARRVLMLLSRKLLVGNLLKVLQVGFSATGLGGRLWGVLSCWTE